MAEAPDQKQVAAKVDAICSSFLSSSWVLAWGWKILTAFSLVASPVACYVTGQVGPDYTPAISSPFWSAVSSGLGTTVLAAILGYMFSEALGGWPASRAADWLNRLYPVGRERDLALSLLQERRQELTGEKAAAMTKLLRELGAYNVQVVGPVETQLTEALETLAAGREEPADKQPTDKPRRRLQSGGVIPLQPEGADDRGPAR